MKYLMIFIDALAAKLADASDNKAGDAGFVIFISWLIFNLVESMVEEAIFGEPFLHFIDFIVAALVVIMFVRTVHICAMRNRDHG